MSFSLTPTLYLLKSVASGRIYQDDGWMLDPDSESQPSLLRTLYSSTRIHLRDKKNGLYQYADWMPIRRILNGSAPPITYRSKNLAEVIGLRYLWITFSGYWPEKGSMMKTCTFKETEAYSVCARLPENTQQILVVASAGNTARAFARVCSDNQIPLLLCVPVDNIDVLWSDQPFHPCVKLICTDSGSDYSDAIYLSNLAASTDGFLAEGGAKNVARRDGMASTLLSAVHAIGQIPEYYFQAVGSGTGAIAAWEANLRLIEDGRFGYHKAKLILSQNEPFTPMYDSWKAGSRDLLPIDEEKAHHQIAQMYSKVLSNRKPPYSMAGGLFDALTDTNGDMLKVNNNAAIAATELFPQTEGIDIHPAAGVAAASLIQAINSGLIPPEATIMLNITGGGEKLFQAHHQLNYLEPSRIFSPSPDQEEVSDFIKFLFRDYIKQYSLKEIR